MSNDLGLSMRVERKQNWLVAQNLDHTLLGGCADSNSGLAGLTTEPSLQIHNNLLEKVLRSETLRLVCILASRARTESQWRVLETRRPQRV